MKNLMPEVLKLIGLSVDEEFKVKGSDEIFKVDKEGMLIATSYNSFRCSILPFLLNGTYEIVKLPWKPKDGESYWTVEEDRILCDSWDNDMMDYSYLKLGNCYRTKEEAEANADRIRKEIMG